MHGRGASGNQLFNLRKGNAMNLHLFATQIGMIHHMAEGDVATLSAHDGMAPVKIHRLTNGEYFVNGKWQGSAYGAVSIYTAHVSSLLLLDACPAPAE